MPPKPANISMDGFQIRIQRSLLRAHGVELRSFLLRALLLFYGLEADDQGPLMFLPKRAAQLAAKVWLVRRAAASECRMQVFPEGLEDIGSTYFGAESTLARLTLGLTYISGRPTLVLKL